MKGKLKEKTSTRDKLTFPLIMDLRGDPKMFDLLKRNLGLRVSKIKVRHPIGQFDCPIVRHWL